MALKKPSDFFNDDQQSKSSFIEESGNIPENFGAYKKNVEVVEVLSDFTENFGTLKNNVDKIQQLEGIVEELKEEVFQTLSKEDLDRAMVSNLLILEENIKKIQDNLQGINKKDLKRIYEEVQNITDSVSFVVEEELPKYKNLIKNNEYSLDKRLLSYQKTVEEKLDSFDESIQQKFEVIEEELEGINDTSLNDINLKVSSLSGDINFITQKELPKYKKQITESSIKFEEKFSSISENIEEYQQELNNKIKEIEDSFKDLVEQEVPKYQNFLIEARIQSDAKIEELSNELSDRVNSLIEKTTNLSLEVENKSNSLSESFENKVSSLENYITEAKENLQEVSKTYQKLTTAIEAKGLSDKTKFDSHEQLIETISERVSNTEKYIEKVKQEIVEKNNDYYAEEFNKIEKKFTTKLNLLENDIERKNSKLKEANSTLVDNLLSIKEQVNNLPFKTLEESYKKISNKLNHIEKVFENFNEKTFLKEDGSLLTGLESQKTKDPLTPLDQKFVTFDDLSNHYRQFINRIQIQLASIGGGGAGFMYDLADVEFDASTGDGKLLIYNQATSRWVGIDSTALSLGGSVGAVGAGGTWQVDSVGIHTTKNVGIGTSANSNYKLYVDGNAFFTGNISVAGTVTSEDVTNIDSIGVITARQDVQIGNNLSVVGLTTLGSANGIGTVYVGLGSTALYVDGNARIVGVLTVGRASVTIDGDNNTITTGIVTISSSTITLGENITLSGNASGINSAPNVIYVAKDGNDQNNGTTIDNAKLTIAGAVGIATTGTIIRVLSGNYLENNPIEVPAFVSIVGSDLKTVTVSPNVATKDIFHVRKGCYIANLTFTNHLAPSAAIGFPTTEIATNVGGGSWESPYIQNCTSNTTTGTGLKIDGAQAEGLKSIVCDSYTQYNQGGVGVAITNAGYAQLVSVFTICCNVGVSCHKGAQCSLTNSNTSFGTYGLLSDGAGDVQFTGIVTSTASVSQDNVVVSITTTTRPYDGQVVFFDRLYYAVESITLTSGGSGYVTTPSVTISAPDGPNGETATAFATLSGDTVESITIISSGSQYSSTPSVTISAPDSGSTATATANITPLYYTINSSTPVTAGITTLTLDENLNNSVSAGTTAYFYQISRISASSHTFEYVGSGNNITTATPLTGGVPIQENEVVEINGGKVIYTSTDQSGNFRIGDGLQINQNTGTISGRAFSRSLFAEMTPFILALS